MKLSFKRVLSVVLALCVLLTMAAGIGSLSASADDQSTTPVAEKVYKITNGEYKVFKSSALAAGEYSISFDYDLAAGAAMARYQGSTDPVDATGTQYLKTGYNRFESTEIAVAAGGSLGIQSNSTATVLYVWNLEITDADGNAVDVSWAAGHESMVVTEMTLDEAKAAGLKTKAIFKLVSGDKEYQQFFGESFNAGTFEFSFDYYLKTGAARVQNHNGYADVPDATTNTASLSVGCGSYNSGSVDVAAGAFYKIQLDTPSTELYIWNYKLTMNGKEINWLKNNTPQGYTGLYDITVTEVTEADIPHAYGDWQKDADGHWKECAHGATEKAAHIPGAAATETTPQTCTECGYELAPVVVPPVTGEVYKLVEAENNWSAFRGAILDEGEYTLSFDYNLVSGQAMARYQGQKDPLDATGTQFLKTGYNRFDSQPFTITAEDAGTRVGVQLNAANTVLYIWNIELTKNGEEIDFFKESYTKGENLAVTAMTLDEASAEIVTSKAIIKMVSGESEYQLFFGKDFSAGTFEFSFDYHLATGAARVMNHRGNADVPDATTNTASLSTGRGSYNSGSVNAAGGTFYKIQLDTPATELYIWNYKLTMNGKEVNWLSNNTPHAYTDLYDITVTEVTEADIPEDEGDDEQGGTGNEGEEGNTGNEGEEGGSTTEPVKMMLKSQNYKSIDLPDGTTEILEWQNMVWTLDQNSGIAKPSTTYIFSFEYYTESDIPDALPAGHYACVNTLYSGTEAFGPNGSNQSMIWDSVNESYHAYALTGNGRNTCSIEFTTGPEQRDFMVTVMAGMNEGVGYTWFWDFSLVEKDGDGTNLLYNPNFYGTWEENLASGNFVAPNDYRTGVLTPSTKALDGNGIFTLVEFDEEMAALEIGELLGSGEEDEGTGDEEEEDPWGDLWGDDEDGDTNTGDDDTNAGDEDTNTGDDDTNAGDTESDGDDIIQTGDTSNTATVAVVMVLSLAVLSFASFKVFKKN